LSKVLPDNLILLGEVIRPHGTGGLLRIWSYAHSEETFLNAGTVHLKSDREEIREYRVLSVKPHKKAFLMKLDGLSSLEEAERYRGAEIMIRRDSLIRESEDEFFWFELIGLRVHLNSGRYIGTIEDILATGSNDIYVVREGKTEHLIPATNNVIEEINLDKKRMIISEMEGLLDLNEV